MKVINKVTGKDVTRDVIAMLERKSGFGWKVILEERSTGNRTLLLKADQWDRAMAYAEEGYKVIDL